tara:strand:- start:1294 stop:1806 length:513 start_codon:yes stop_codon:yes gene_type:complete
MALQSSGAISLNDIHVELDGSSASGTTVSLNDTDVRALVSISSGEITLEDFYGASANWVVTEGQSGSSIFGHNASVGSISPTTYNGATITAAFYFTATFKGSTTHSFTVTMTGNRAKSFFSLLSGDGVSLSSASASHSYNSSTTQTSWVWSLNSAPSGWDGTGTRTVSFT